MTYWFTSDEHYEHANIIRYSNRPFQNVDEMREVLISNHNSVVGKNDITIHAGDFTFSKNKRFIYENIINRLNGKHIFLIGSHDYWLKGSNSNQIWERNIYVDGKRYCFVVCHYAMHTWPKSHYGSIHLFGHSHGKLVLDGKRHDLGVDNNNYFPISDKQIIEIMKSKEQTPKKYNIRGYE
jgi:calcineurin-like phosphoesterase family protein